MKKVSHLKYRKNNINTFNIRLQINRRRMLFINEKEFRPLALTHPECPFLNPPWNPMDKTRGKPDSNITVAKQKSFAYCSSALPIQLT